MLINIKYIMKCITYNICHAMRQNKETRYNSKFETHCPQAVIITEP